MRRYKISEKKPGRIFWSFMEAFQIKVQLYNFAYQEALDDKLRDGSNTKVSSKKITLTINS